MIAPNELRIGNLVYDNEGKVCEVDCIDVIDGYVASEDQKFDDYKHRFDPNPIPLTEEWMVKFGFVYGNNHGAWVLLSDKSRGDYLDENVGFVYHGFNIPDFHIKYVHQFQNYFYANNGTELTLTT